MLKRNHILLLMMIGLFFWSFSWANNYGLPTYTTKRITGTFGECRINANTYVKRFNIGLALSTNSVENTKIYAMNDGVVWKLVINDPIYGNIIYLKHPDGLATIYGHLNRFSSEYDAILKSVMVEFGEESNTIIEFNSNEYTVRKGDVIGYSGQTGSAIAPYCHVEFFDIAQSMYIDPLVYLKDQLNRPDSFLDFVKVRVDGKEQNISNGGSYYYSNPIPQIEINARLEDNNRRSRYGVHRVQLFFNDEEVYQLLFETIPENFQEQGDLVFGEGSTSSYYWYKLYSTRREGVIVLNRLNEMTLGATTKARIIIEDDWGNAKSWDFYLKK
ncbi:MAG TPA: M23 family metallopeptidase [Thermotogota bacterium]|nr:M23 family metallopeptidase [Thermotogota bacterium]HRW35248.1 M23 family metallopeptidase [Thermotogota bacterium]